tara:strand:+ start:1092 stop:1619 length:528 start_codon:yes stop_codon:yes gene_type:complete
MTLDISVAIETSKGTINLTLTPDETPVTVSSFVNLAKRGYYDGLNFHRVISNFMVQGGCPQGTGTGNPGYSFEDEFDASMRHDGPGVLSMANAGPRTNGSQFFITHGPQPHLDDAHAVFGKVNSADDQAVVDAIEQGDAIISMTASGDVDELLAANADRVTEWNSALDDRFPNLK